MDYRYIKRSIDIILSAVGLLLLLPFLLVIAILIKTDSKGPVFFVQKRIGQRRELFNIIKFRTMMPNVPKDVPTHLLDHPEHCVTRVGRILRKTSMDELPQLWNVLKGDMSIIGPRPALWNQHDLIELREKHDIHCLKPGVSGLAQINGRDELPIQEKVQYDKEYLEGFGLSMDFKIFILTMVKIVKGEGIKEGKHENTHYRKK